MKKNDLIDFIIKEQKRAESRLAKARKLEEDWDYTDVEQSMERMYAEGYAQAFINVLETIEEAKKKTTKKVSEKSKKKGKSKK